MPFRAFAVFRRKARSLRGGNEPGVSMPFRAFAVFRLKYIAKLDAVKKDSINALSGIRCLSTKQEAMAIRGQWVCINALSGIRCLSTFFRVEHVSGIVETTYQCPFGHSLSFDTRRRALRCSAMIILSINALSGIRCLSTAALRPVNPLT